MKFSIPKKNEFKRCFFDIETSQAVMKGWRVGYNLNIDAGRIVKDSAIICVSWKWEGYDTVYNLKWKDGCDKELLTEFVKMANVSDEMVAHNGDRFDIKWITGRCIYHGIDCYPKYKTVDTLKMAKRHKFPSNKLDYLAKYLKVGGKIETGGIALWDAVEDGDKKALKKMVEYCDNDVIILEKVYQKLARYSEPTTHRGIFEHGDKWECGHCGSGDVNLEKTRYTAKGTPKRQMKCHSCNRYYTISNASYQDYLTYKQEQKQRYGK